jgi:RNA polymerase sigma-70 factor (ECF subfamily)
MSKLVGPEDGVLITQYRNGNEAAFDLLVDRYKSKVYTTIYRIVKDQDVAEDLLQDVFVKVVNTLHSDKYNEEGKFQPWVMRIAHNLAIDYFRKAKRKPTILLEDGSSLFNSMRFAEESSEELRIKEETLDLVRKLIDELPEAQKEVVILRHYMDLSFQEIADQTGVSINTALGRMRYALNHIRKKMKQVNSAYDKIIYPK